MKDVHNMLAAMKKGCQGGQDSTARVRTYLEDFCDVDGNVAHVYTSNDNLVYA